MTRVPVLLFTALFAAACTTTTTPAPTPVHLPATEPVHSPGSTAVHTPGSGAVVTPASAGTAAPCNPGHVILNATLWVQQSAEYRAAAMQTYAAATRALDAALADPNWVGAEEETSSDPSQPPAVILDVDETSLDNTPFQARVIAKGMTYDKTMWVEWVKESAAPPVPGAREFLAYARSRGVTPFYITNRDAPDQTPGTQRNLELAGFPIDPNGETLMLRGENGWKSDKSQRRAHVAKSYRVLLLLGDDLNDFADARDKSAAERDAIMARTQSFWGTRWFMIPNPMYGSWEDAAIGEGGTACEEVQRKVDALRNR